MLRSQESRDGSWTTQSYKRLQPTCTHYQNLSETAYLSQWNRSQSLQHDGRKEDIHSDVIVEPGLLLGTHDMTVLSGRRGKRSVNFISIISERTRPYSQKLAIHRNSTQEDYEYCIYRVTELKVCIRDHCFALTFGGYSLFTQPLPSLIQSVHDPPPIRSMSSHVVTSKQI